MFLTGIKSSQWMPTFNKMYYPFLPFKKIKFDTVFYYGHTAHIIVNSKLSETTPLQSGPRQGCL